MYYNKEGLLCAIVGTMFAETVTHNLAVQTYNLAAHKLISTL